MLVLEKQVKNDNWLIVGYTTETGSVFSETRETVAVSDKRERFGSRGLKPSNKKSNAHEHIPLCGLSLSSSLTFSHALLLIIR